MSNFDESLDDLLNEGGMPDGRIWRCTAITRRWSKIRRSESDEMREGKSKQGYYLLQMDQHGCSMD